MKRNNHLIRKKRSIAPRVFDLCAFCLVAVGAVFFARSLFIKSGLHTAAAVTSKPVVKSSAPASNTVSMKTAKLPLWVSVSIKKQTLIVYDAKKRVVKKWLCSTGSPGYDTPKGTYHLTWRKPKFFSNKYNEGGYWCAFFHGGYAIHSVPFDKKGKIIQSIANDLGHKDSHGCVHLSIANSKWVYDNLPNGAKVVVS